MSWAKLPAELRHMVLFEVIDASIPDLAYTPKPSEVIAAYRAGRTCVKLPEGSHYWIDELRITLFNLTLVNSTMAMDLQQPITRARDQLRQDDEHWKSRSDVEPSEAEYMDFDDFMIWYKSCDCERKDEKAVIDGQLAVLKKIFRTIEQLKTKR